jgi:hypothetical protein
MSKLIALTTLPASGITNTTAIAYGVIDSISGETISQVGFYIEPLTGTTFQSSNYTTVGVPFSRVLSGLLPNTYYGVTAYAIATGDTRYNDSAQDFTTAPNPPEIGKITQPINSNEKGSVRFINIPNGADTIIWSGTKTGSTTTSGGTSFTVTGLTIGTYLFSIKGDFPNQPFSPTTTVVIAVPVTELSSTGYKLFERTGIGDGAAEAAFNAEFAAIDRTIFVETNYTPDEIVLGNIK